MKLNIKTLKNVEVEVEVDEKQTINELMVKVEGAFPNMPANRQKLIHAGKILKGDLAISDYPDIKEGDKIIVIVSKVCNGFKKPDDNKEKDVSETSTVDHSSMTTEIKADSSTVNTLEPSSNTSSNFTSALSRLVVGEELEQSIQRIVEMGFSRAQVEKAMAAAFNNPDRAVEFLSTGNFNNIGLDEPRVPSLQPTDIGEQNFDAGLDSLQAIQSHPMFQQLRQVVQTNPRMLQQILDNLGQTNPALLQTILENQDEFMELLNSDTGNTDPFADNSVNIVSLTQTEMESVQRLEGLGFTRQAVIEAFLACDKNEELAANYLLENAADFMAED